jgi:hypothetical protein
LNPLLSLEAYQIRKREDLAYQIKKGEDLLKGHLALKNHYLLQQHVSKYRLLVHVVMSLTPSAYKMPQN